MVDNKVLILSANYGEGHAQVSKALVSQLKIRGFENVKVLNLMAQSHPLIDNVSRQFYLKSYTSIPSLYGWLYHSTKNLPLDSKRAQLLHSFGLNKMKQLIEEEKPDLLIHTFPGSAAAELKRKGELSLPIFSVITDFTFHQRWIHKQIDHYFVATEQLKNDIVKAGEPSKKVSVSGIPIRSSFEESVGSHDLYEKYNLDPSKKLVLMMAGAYGVSSDVKKICAAFTQDESCQVVLICGKKQSLEEEMREKFKAYPHIKVMGYVNTLHELMQMASCMVSKPGGVTISEALAKGLPLIFLPPVSGQEEENARFLEEKGAAIIVKRRPKMGQFVLEFLKDEHQLKNMKHHAEALYICHAADRIAEQVSVALRKEAKQRSNDPLKN